MNKHMLFSCRRPIQGNLDHLHPEYEVSDWRGRSYFGDFAFLPAGIRPIDVENHLSMNHRQAVKLLQSLVSEEILETIKTGNGQRMRYYQLRDIPLES